MPTTKEEDPSLSQFRFQRKHRTKKGKRGNEFVYELRDVPDINEEIEDTMKTNNGDKVVDDVDPLKPVNPEDYTAVEENAMDSGEVEDGIGIDSNSIPINLKPTPQQKFSE